MVLTFKLSDDVFIMLMNVNNCWHFNIISMINFMLSRAKHEQSFITSHPGYIFCKYQSAAHL